MMYWNTDSITINDVTKLLRIAHTYDTNLPKDIGFPDFDGTELPLGQVIRRARNSIKCYWNSLPFIVKQKFLLSKVRESLEIVEFWQIQLSDELRLEEQRKEGTVTGCNAGSYKTG